MWLHAPADVTLSITTIICPDDLIATVAALTLAIRVIGGSIGYCVYYNVFVHKFETKAVECKHTTARQSLLVLDIASADTYQTLAVI